MRMKKEDKMRMQIKNGLECLSESNQAMFKLLYSHEDTTLPIHEIVDNMPERRLKHALFQVENTVIKRFGGPNAKL